MPVTSKIQEILKHCTNHVQAIRQLASLLRQADQLFTALGEEVVTIQTRTEGLGARVTSLATIADNYDPRKQPIRKWI